uniref:trimethyltridecatetraene synthase n=1 Tax=Zea mays TaxID=4577 RepID=A0A804LKQ0_MAIZE
MELPAPSSASFFLVAVVAGATLFLVTVLRLRARSTRKYRLPPGPRPWPVIGNLNLIGPLPHHSVHELSKRYGPLMSLRFGSFPVVVASSIDTARLILKTHDLAFIDRPQTAAGSDEVRAMLSDLRAAASAPAGGHDAVTLREHLYMVNLSVVSRMLLGKKYVVEGSSSPATPEEFRWLIDEHFFLNGVLNVADMIPWLSPLDPQGYVKRMKRSAKMLDRFLEHVVDEHNERRRREGEDFVAMDMMDVLLELADDPSQLEVPITRDNVKGFTLDLMGGGTDTSAVTVEWAMSELLRNPEVLAKATEELDRVVGRNRLVAEGDIPSLPYLDAVVKETLRLHPVAPLLTPRLCREDVSVGGYDIPAGARVFVNAWAIGRDPAVWEAPLEFRPERFAGSGVDVKGQHFELLPFGSGRRMCPGMGLALRMVPTILGNLLHAFAWRLPDGVAAEELGMEETFGLTVPRLVPLQAVAEPKLPARLYAVL